MGNKWKMSEGHEKLQLQEDDVLKFLASGMHLGARNCETVMQDYSYARKSDGIHIINLRKTWEKLLQQTLWHTCCIEVCCSHRCIVDCWPFHSRNLHESDPEGLP